MIASMVSFFDIDQVYHNHIIFKSSNSIAQLRAAEQLELGMFDVGHPVYISNAALALSQPYLEKMALTSICSCGKLYRHILR